jgi:hypothetical protein
MYLLNLLRTTKFLPYPKLQNQVISLKKVRKMRRGLKNIEQGDPKEAFWPLGTAYLKFRVVNKFHYEHQASL